jgi:hypothetical protein
MNTAAAQTISVAPPRALSQPQGNGDLKILAVIFVLVASAWAITRLGLFKSGDDISYWIAVCGGSMMLLLFAYPMRKYLRFMQSLGKVKWWFSFHIALGILGPWLILVHSTFRVGSLNGGVALYSMAIVVASGVIGRVIYVRVHRGLHGERTTLRELQVRAGLTENDARARLRFAPAVEARLIAFEKRELAASPGWATNLRRVTILPLSQWVVYRACVADLREPLRVRGRERGWSADKAKERRRQAHALVRQYLNAVMRVAQFSAYERVFALWHIAHLPFIYLLVVSAIVHVVAVHAY